MCGYHDFGLFMSSKPDSTSTTLSALLRMRSNQRLVEKFGSDSISNIVKALTTTSHIHHNYVFLDARRVITIDEDAIKDGAVVWHVSEEKFMEIFKEEEAKLGDARDCHCSSIEQMADLIRRSSAIKIASNSTVLCEAGEKSHRPGS